MLYAGRNIQAVSDILTPISVEYFYQSLQHPRPEIETRVRQLRIIRQIDAKLYSKSKKLLPYIVCATFSPLIRKTENFAFTDHFIIDLDNLQEKQIDINTLRSNLKSDPRVVLMFVSPGEDGLKVLFNLKSKCYDAGLYKLFYQEFARRFSKQYHLEQVIDSKTCDVSRACFVSIDPDAYYNQQAEAVDIEEYLNFTDTSSLFDLKHEHESIEKENRKQEKEPVKSAAEPEGDVLATIKETLKLRSKKVQERPTLSIYVPERLEQIMQDLKSFIEDQGIEVYEVQSIQYGKKIKGKLGAKLAEVNLFYGKRGFRVVKTVKGILSDELNDVLMEIIQIYLQENT